MPQGDNDEFLAQQGNTEQLPGKDVPRAPNGRFDTPRAQMGREHALDILTDEKYRDSLKARMIAGVAGAIEVWVWRIGYGEPKKDDTEAEEVRRRFEQIREEAKRFLRLHPEAASIIDAEVQGASSVLPRPQLKAISGGHDEPA